MILVFRLHSKLLFVALIILVELVATFAFKRYYYIILLTPLFFALDMFGLSDPFCVVKFNGVEVGRTGIIHKTLNPVWSGER